LSAKHLYKPTAGYSPDAVKNFSRTLDYRISRADGVEDLTREWIPVLTVHIHSRLRYYMQK
jgi:hypothetical protein